MRILSLTAQKPSSTGSGVYLTELMKSFSEHNAEQAIIYGCMEGDTEPEFLQSVKQYRIKYNTPELNFPILGMSDNMPYKATRYRDLTQDQLSCFMVRYKKVIEEAIRDFKPDLFICHHLYLATAIASHIAKEIPDRKFKIVGICHGTDIRQMEKIDLNNVYIRAGINSLDKVLVLTSEQREEIERVYGTDKTIIEEIGTGYNSSLFNINENELENRDEEGVLFVGKISEQKGVRSLINSISHTQDLLKRNVTFVGGYSKKQDFNNLVNYAEEKKLNADFIGVIPQEKVVDFYKKNKVFCLPSFFEGLPLVYLEALACGCVCVATALPGIKEWYTKFAPEAPMIFIDPPLMDNVDIPRPEELPDFEERLKNAIEVAFTLNPNPKSVEHLSWDNLAMRVLRFVNLSL